MDPLHLEQPLILLYQRVLRMGQNELKRGLVEILERRYDRKAPTNSGIRPYLSKSSGSISRNISPCFLSSGVMTLAPKPIEPGRLRAEMIFSRPVNAPPHTNRILVVSTCRNSCCGCLRPPCGGTFAVVPSMSLSSACCTPSPETSRMIEGLSDLR